MGRIVCVGVSSLHAEDLVRLLRVVVCMQQVSCFTLVDFQVVLTQGTSVIGVDSVGRPLGALARHACKCVFCETPAPLHCVHLPARTCRDITAAHMRKTAGKHFPGYT